jgi:type IV pilus assembly protein PilB
MPDNAEATTDAGAVPGISGGDEQPEAKAKRLGVPLVSDFPKNIEKAALALIPEDTARKNGMFAYSISDGILRVAMLDPQNFEALNILRFLAEKERMSIEISLTTKVVFEEALHRYTGTDEALKDAILSLKKGEDIKISEERKTVMAGDEIFQDAPIAKLVEVIVRHAMDGRASDIHIEPIEGSYRVRFRVDGVLRAQLTFPAEVGRAVISRIKILSNMKIDEKRKPQDGRFRFTAGDHSVDLRVSSLPVMEGEKIVMRVLDKTGNTTDLDKLGLWGRNREVMSRKIREPFGIILITGPTGSGKSTTLYSFLQILNQEERNIITLEDPVEYHLDGVNQSQIRPEIGYTFASGLRSILRQDPNVIMVGEIRDSETAELAIHAALTGHLVLSTLHTNDAIGAIPRLVDMKIEPFLLSSSLQVVAAQRLVRKICESCKEQVPISDGQRRRLQEIYADTPMDQKKQYGLKPEQEMVVYHGKGCEECGGTGTRGRIAIYEVIDVNEEIKIIISDKQGNERDVRKAAMSQGMMSMKQDGLLKVLLGITTLAEVERATEGKLLLDEA